MTSAPLGGRTCRRLSGAVDAGTGILTVDNLNEVMLLLLTLGYFTAGVHADRPLMWIGVLLGLGYVVVTLVSAYAWTMVGFALAIGLAIAGLRGGRSHEAAC